LEQNNMILQNKLQQAKQLEQIARSIYREILKEIMDRTPNYRVYDYLAEMLENYDKVDFLSEAVSEIFKNNIYQFDIGMELPDVFSDDELFIFIYEEDDDEIIVTELVFETDENNVIQDIIVKHNYDEE
jgi:hypothetical protein